MNPTTIALGIVIIILLALLIKEKMYPKDGKLKELIKEGKSNLHKSRTDYTNHNKIIAKIYRLRKTYYSQLNELNTYLFLLRIETGNYHNRHKKKK